MKANVNCVTVLQNNEFCPQSMYTDFTLILAAMEIQCNIDIWELSEEGDRLSFLLFSLLFSGRYCP
jgi:hypothetical protein